MTWNKEQERPAKFEKKYLKLEKRRSIGQPWEAIIKHEIKTPEIINKILKQKLEAFLICFCRIFYLPFI